MPADLQHMNTSAAQFAISGSTTITINSSQGLTYSANASQVDHSGDADVGPRHIVTDYTDPRVDLPHNDIAANLSLPEGTRGTFTCKVHALKQGIVSGGGGLNVTLANAVVVESGFSVARRQVATCTLGMRAEFPDGVTNPFTVAAITT